MSTLFSRNVGVLNFLFIATLSGGINGFSTISDILIRSCDQTITIDKYLVEKGLSERSICHRLAVYLEQNITEYEYFTDCEYNGDCDSKSGKKFINYLDFQSKKIYNPEDEEIYKKSRRSKNIFPDIIIHRRNNAKDGNLLAIEIKKSNNYDKNAIEWDRIKISSYTSSKNDNHYNYLFGAIIKFKVGKNPSHEITWYQDGKILKNMG